MTQYRETLQRPPFEPVAFVGRSDEIIGRSNEVKIVLAKAKLMCAGEEVEKRVTVFSGESALGKTWLLRQIEHELSVAPCPDRMRSYRLDIPERSAIQDDFDATKEVKKILETFAKNVLGEDINEVSLPELSRKVMEKTKAYLGDYSLVLFVDAVFEADWNFLELLEEHLLGPLAIMPNVLIVLSGRGRKFPWATPELRFRADFYDLEPFNLEETRAQIVRLDKPELAASDNLALIYEIGQGVPGATVWLAQDEKFFENRNPERLDAILNHLLPEEDRLTIRRYVEALCVLRAFDDDRVSKMVQVYEQIVDHKPDNHTISYGVSANIQKRLVHEALAQYQNAQGAYILDKYLAKLAEEYLRMQNPELWRRLHETARDLYADWIKKYERTKDRWIAEKAYHEDALTSESTD